jgi:simple sugar transport system ATP-binding protein
VANGIGARDSDGGWPLRNLAFSVRAYEIVGIVGVAGNGQRELEQIVTGLRHPDEGYVEVAGARPRGVKQFIRAGLAHIPEDRRSMGLIPEESIWLNAAIKRYRKPPIARGPMVRGHKAREYAKELASRVSLSTSRVTTPVGHLSGGNAQKLLTGRELDADPKVVVAVNPTQGLDLGAAINVRSQLAAARDRGLGVLLIAADLDEVLELADRLLVLYEGEIAGETLAIDADRGRIGLLMGGAGRDAGGG